jgi:hypothetical protein
MVISHGVGYCRQGVESLDAANAVYNTADKSRSPRYYAPDFLRAVYIGAKKACRQSDLSMSENALRRVQ